MTTSRRPVPTRPINTDYGPLRATCARRNEVRFTTRGTQSPLVINRVPYSCNLCLTRCDDDTQCRLDHLGDRWHRLHSSSDLRRHESWGRATDRARRILHDEIAPQLVTWLDTDSDAQALLDEGAAHWRAELLDHADTAERTLTEAFETVQTLRCALAAGDTISPNDERYLRHLRAGTGYL